MDGYVWRLSRCRALVLWNGAELTLLFVQVGSCLTSRRVQYSVVFSGGRFTHPIVATWVIPKEVEVRKLALGNNLEKEIFCLQSIESYSGRQSMTFRSTVFDCEHIPQAKLQALHAICQAFKLGLGLMASFGSATGCKC